MSGIAITFPSSPSEGQSYLAQNGFTYIYDSQKNRWKRGGDFVRAPKVLSFAGVAVTTTGSGITTGPTGALIYNVPGFLIPSSDVGVDSYKAYRYSESYPNYTEIQVSISSAFSSIAYAATSTSTTFSIPAGTLSGDATYYVRARQFVGSDASSAGVGAISGYSANIVSFATTSTFIDAPIIVSIAGDTDFPVYQIGFAGTTLPATVTYTGSGVGNLDRVDWRVTGPRIPSSTGDTALAEIGIGTHNSATLANALVLALPFSGATGVGITDDVNNAIRTASGASAGTTKTITNAGAASTVSIAGLALTSHFYPSAAYFNGGTTSYLSITDNGDFDFNADFTWEMWFNIPALPSSDYHLFAIPNTNGFNYNRNNFGVDSSGRIQLQLANLTSFTTMFSNSKVSPNTWNHIAAVRRSNVYSIYLNGVLEASQTNTNTFPSADYNVVYVGAYVDRDNTFFTPRFYVGYLQDFKIYKGLAKYQENFTPPLPTYGTLSYTTGTTNTGINTTAYFQSTGDVGIAETSSTAANALVLAMPMNRTFGFQDINVAIRGLTSGASAGTAKTVGLGTTSTANAPSHPIISATESKWYDGAAYFDGGDYVSIPYNSELTFGSGDFTVELWINPTLTSASNVPIIGIWDDAASAPQSWVLYRNTTNNLVYLIDVASADTQIFASSNNLFANVWQHIAVTRSGNSWYMFINGVQVATASNASSMSGGSAPFQIGRNQNNGGGQYNGYIQDLKIYKGFAKYTANFTPPQPICGFTTDISTQTGFTTTTATGALLSSVVGLGSTSTLAFSADQNLIGVTSITSSSGISTLPDPYAQNLVLALPLANITGVGNSFTNDRTPQIDAISLVTVGAAKTITNSGVTTVSLGSTSKWYGNTSYFNGSNYVTVPNSSDLDFGAGDFTIEFWANSLSSGNHWIVGKGNAATVSGSTLSFYTGVGWDFYYNTSSILTLTSPTYTNEWAHIAVVRNGTEIRIYKNGSLFSSGTIGTGILNTTSNNLQIGQYSSTGITGYIQDVKIYKGLAKYTTNFTPPPPMFGDYTRSTPNKIIFTPASDYVLEAKNTSGIITSSYSATRQWGTKPEGGIYDPYAGNLVLAIPGGAVGGATTTFDVTGQIKFETPTATYVNAGIVTYSNSLGIGTYQNKTVTNTGPVSISSTITKYYSRSMQFNGSSAYLEAASSSDFALGTDDFTIEFWLYHVSGTDRGLFANNSGSSVGINFLVGGLGPFRVYNGTSANNLFDYPVSPSANTWQHLALVRRNGLMTLFIDGIPRGTTNWSGVNAGNTATFSVGSAFGNGRFTFGYINDFRMYKGIAKYTSNFTPPNQIYLT